MAFRSKLSFHVRLFLTLLSLLALFLICFLLFQFKREKTYKADRFNAELQVLNTRFIHYLPDTTVLDSLFFFHPEQMPDGLRLTVMDTLGRVLFDTEKSKPLESFSKHADRPEFVDALVYGSGYTIRRLSATTNREYFYSATRSGRFVVRSAMPYSVTLKEILRADRLFFPVMTGMALLISCLALFLTRRLGHNINRLKKFALLADKGEPLDGVGPFPKDELGEISNHIIQLYSRLKQTKEALESEHRVVLHQKMEQTRLKKQLTQNINHELKTPVSIILGYLETLHNNPRMDQERQRIFMENCFRQTNRLSQLLNDISTITRMDEASEIIEKTEVNLSDIIHDVFADVAKNLLEKNIQTEIRIPSQMPVQGNQGLLQSVFRNLTDNAIAYSGCHTIFVSLTTTDNEHYSFVFGDDGVGIEAHHLPRIFERFYRVDTGRSRRQGGTGLGLSIVRNAVILHGGTICAATRSGGGLEFIFTLRKK